MKFRWRNEVRAAVAVLKASHIAEECIPLSVRLVKPLATADYSHVLAHTRGVSCTTHGALFTRVSEPSLSYGGRSSCSSTVKFYPTFEERELHVR